MRGGVSSQEGGGRSISALPWEEAKKVAKTAKQEKAQTRDPVTGSQVSAYKGNGSSRNGLATLGNDYIVAAQTHKHALHFWSWHRVSNAGFTPLGLLFIASDPEQVLQRSFAAEALTCLACSPDGAYLAAGGASGTLYLWEVGSGRLLRAWAAHYKAFLPPPPRRLPLRSCSWAAAVCC
eukprot:XP_001696652.1 predicted protein [Chlamydomonas reinhardtii]